MSKKITLKRSATIKVDMTDMFRNQMTNEFQAMITLAEKKIKDIQTQLQSDAANIAVLDQERREAQNQIQQMTEQTAHIKSLKNGEHFMQGVIDGFVNVDIGDNLYEKLGGMEIIIKDGVITEINPNAKPLYTQP